MSKISAPRALVLMAFFIAASASMEAQRRPTDPSEAAAPTQEPGEGVWRNYDFTPGKEVWFVSDFSDERVGRFPATQLEFVQGNMQIVELYGERVLEVAQNSLFRVNLPEMLPEDFTVVPSRLFRKSDGKWPPSRK